MHLYTLATDYQSYIKERNSEGKENIDNRSLNNIFNDKSINKNDINNLTSVKSYQIVGFKELKSMEDKFRRGKKNTFKKDTLFRDDRPLSKQSSQRTQNNLMTKRQLFQSLPHINQATLIRSNQSNLIYSRTEQSHLDKDCSRYQMNTVHQTDSDSKFSISRIKISMQERKQEWKKLMTIIKRDNYRFPSILKSSDLYRAKIENRIKKEKYEQMANLNSNKWPQILRKDISLGDIIHKKVITQTIHDGALTSRGTSKLRLQEEWLSQKQEEGYRFKKYVDKLKKTARKNE